jgi:excisionase family DNA binding protein
VAAGRGNENGPQERPLDGHMRPVRALDSIAEKMRILRAAELVLLAELRRRRSDARPGDAPRDARRRVGLVAQSAPKAIANNAPLKVVTAQPKALGHQLGQPVAPRLAPGQRLLSVTEAATYLGVSVRTVWRLIDNGTLRRVTLPRARRALVDVRDLDSLTENGKA